MRILTPQLICILLCLLENSLRGQTERPSQLSGIQAIAREPSSSSERLPRENLLIYRDDRNVPAAQWRTANSIADWQHRRSEIMSGVRAIMGELPGPEKKCELAIELLEEVDCGSYVRRLISYQSEPRCRVPAYLLVPKRLLENVGLQAPAVLCLHGTDDVVGHGIVVGLGQRPNRQYASELAERGFVTLAPSYPLLANYQPDLTELGWESGTLKAVWDNMRGLDLLQSLPYVDAGSLATMGHSLGGHNSVFTGVWDERQKVIISSCGLDSFLDYYSGNEQVWKAERGWTQTRYMPRLAEYKGHLEDIPFDFHELIACLAPRHVLVIAPVSDSNFNAGSVDRVVEAARPVFRLYGCEDHLQLEHPDCDHDFPEEMRLIAYELLERVLLGKSKSQ